MGYKMLNHGNPKFLSEEQNGDIYYISTGTFFQKTCPLN